MHTWPAGEATVKKMGDTVEPRHAFLQARAKNHRQLVRMPKSDMIAIDWGTIIGHTPSMQTHPTRDTTLVRTNTTNGSGNTSLALTLSVCTIERRYCWNSSCVQKSRLGTQKGGRPRVARRACELWQCDEQIHRTCQFFV